MAFEEPLGLLLLGFVLLFLLVLDRILRRRTAKVAAFHVIAGIVDSLPKLPPSFLLRVRIQRALLVASALLLALSAAGLVVGDHSSGPLKVILAVDRLSDWNDGEGRPAGWEGVVDAARGFCRGLRKDDRVMVVSSDGVPPTEGFLSPSGASLRLASLAPSDLPLDAEATMDSLEVLWRRHHPDRVAVVTPFPSRWQGRADRRLPLTIVPAPGPPPGPNFSILDVDLRPDLLDPRRVSIFCRVGAFAPPGGTSPLEALLRVSVGDRAVVERKVTLEAGSSRGVVVQGLDVEPGVLTLRLDPADHFLADSQYRAAVGARPFLTVGLSTSGSAELEAALKALPGVTLVALDARGEPGGGEPVDVVVADDRIPAKAGGNLVAIRPPGDLPGLPARGAVSEPGVIEADYTNPLLEEVSFGSLRIDRLPVFLPSGSTEVVATADGYPILMTGENVPRGRMAVLGFDPFSSDWAQDPSFPILVANLVAWAGADAAGRGASFTVGEALDEPLAFSAVLRVGPDGREGEVARALPPSGRLSLAGRHRIPGEGEIYVNLLDEGVGRLMVADPPAAEPFPGLPPLPFRWEMRVPLLVAALALLLLERLAAPRVRAGRVE